VASGNIKKKMFYATPLPSYIHAKVQIFKMITEWLAWDELAQEAKKTKKKQFSVESYHIVGFHSSHQ